MSKTSVEDGNVRNTELPVDDLTPAMNKRLRMKTDLVILPLIVITSTLAFLDKVCSSDSLIRLRLTPIRMEWHTQQCME